jgi:hypothetical protein
MNQKVHTAGRYVETYKKAPLTHLGLSTHEHPLSAFSTHKPKKKIANNRSKAQTILVVFTCMLLFCHEEHQQTPTKSKH